MELTFDPNHFELVIVDEYRHELCVVGPMANDTAVDLMIREHRARGRRLTCLGPMTNSGARMEAIRQMCVQTGCVLVDTVFSQA